MLTEWQHVHASDVWMTPTGQENVGTPIRKHRILHGDEDGSVLGARKKLEDMQLSDGLRN